MNHEAINNARRKINEVLKKEDEKVVVGWRPGFVKREVGEVWTDSEGKTWEQKDGYVSRVTKLDGAKTPWFCPKCEKSMSHRFDSKFWRIRGMCFDCVIKEETQMVVDGTWQEFQKEKIRNNYIAELKDTIIELEHAYEHVSSPEFIHADDTKILMTERWNVDVDKVKEDLGREIIRLKQLYEDMTSSEEDNND